jgi:hypothetical protein
MNPSLLHGHTVKIHNSDLEHRSATYSRCGLYRYDLCITFRDAKPGSLVQFIGLNPSTATEEADDNTVRRCKDFARRWGFSGMVMTNAFAFRSTDPKGLLKVAEPACIRNDEYLTYWSRHFRVERVVVCWGNHGGLNERGEHVLKLLREAAPSKIHHLGMTGMGMPKHPLYLSAKTPAQKMEEKL